ncbi:MAG: diguanylate cyclase [Magnetococcales bacterium]|nr:diguanylate cyclase [Magnetococcales bacterium]
MFKKIAFPKPTITFLILVIPGVLLLGVTIAGLKGLMTLRDAQVAAHMDRERLNLGTHVVDTTRLAQVHFKKQVQEWKNMLIRGHDPEQYRNYQEKFFHQETLVRDYLNLLSPLFKKLEMSREAFEELEKSRTTHQQLSIRYRSAMEQFLATPQNAYRVADQMVQGMDRAPTEALDSLVKMVTHHVRDIEIEAGRRDMANFEMGILGVAVVLLILTVAIIPLLFFLFHRQVTTPITRMIRVITAMADGNLDQKAPAKGCFELVEMANCFNNLAEQLKKTHSGLKSEGDKLTTIILSAREGIVVTDQNDEVVLVNPSTERLLGKTAVQISEEGFFNLLDDPSYLKTYLERAGTGMPDIQVFNSRVLNIHANTIYTRGGEKIGSAALIRDVTEEKRLETELRQLSNTDGLTGLFNRRRMDELLQEELGRAKRYAQPLTLMLFDVDHFKKFNDTHGHAMGDKVLSAIAREMKTLCREMDAPCRYGGEEFCILLPNTNYYGAGLAGERLRKGIEAMTVEGLQVTISIGIAVYPFTEGENPDTFLKGADKALYEAKAAGRNQVCMAAEHQP